MLRPMCSEWRNAPANPQHEGTIPHIERLVEIELGDHGAQVFGNDGPLARFARSP